ncbi:MAG TPA: HAMP domain-containing histidine kinase, partial [Kiloniellaceae bacterium]|nr:HAMP domain-containing histidine kinase [Kiloniellaceae bacterium]
DVLLSCKPKAMIDGFIVTRNGAYNGVATATELMRMTSTIARQRFDRLSGALHQVTEANAAKAKFLANVSHELRTPLNAIIGFSDLLSRRLYGPLTEQQCEHVGYINHSGQLLLSLVDDLLNLSVAEAQQMELHEETVELRKLSASCAKLVEPRAAKAGISLKTELGAQALALRVDEVKLKQILLNLLTNAVKFTPAGGEVRLSLATSLDGEIRIVIADNGIGIREEDIKVILQPFGQAHDKRAHPHQGAGLGLPLSKALIELHGGTLLLRSRLNFGTEVEIRLPAERRVTDGSTHAGAAGCGQQDIA